MSYTPLGSDRLNQIERLLAERYALVMRINALAAGRRWLSLWYFVHIPLSAALFALAFVHIVGALYYSAYGK